MTYLITSVIFTSMMIPGLLSYLILSITDKSRENISILAFISLTVLVGITKTVTIGIVLLSPKPAAAAFWNKIYEFSYLLFFPIIPTVLSCFLPANEYKQARYLKHLISLGAVFTTIFAFFTIVVPELFIQSRTVVDTPYSPDLELASYGPAYYVSMALLLVYILYALGFAVINYIRSRGRSYLKTLSLGFVFTILIVFAKFYGVFSGENPRLVSPNIISRTLLAFTVFSLTVLIAMTQKASYIREAAEEEHGRVKRLSKKLEHLAYDNQMTGLMNRSALVRDLPGLSSLQHTFLMLRIDKLEEINVYHGYSAGDRVIQQIARLCREWLPENGRLYHLDTSSFAMIIQDNIQNTEQFAADLLDAVQNLKIPEARETHCTSSIGLAESNGTPGNYELWFQQATLALEKAELSGNRYVVFNSTLEMTNRRRHLIITSLKQSLDSIGFKLLYQPIVSAEGKLAGAEALIRWEHPELGIIDPDEFIPLAESAGLVHRITDFVIHQTLQDFSGSNKLGPGSWVSINLSQQDLMDKNFIHKLTSLIEKSDSEELGIGFEFSESNWATDWAVSIETIQKIKEIGVPLSLDGFGTGYSSLSYLKDLPLNRLKIDHSFISQIREDSRQTILLNAVVNLGKILGFELVAEGIEDSSQLEFLTKRSCRLFQGYHFSMPMDIHAFRKWQQSLRTAPFSLQKKEDL